MRIVFNSVDKRFEIELRVETLISVDGTKPNVATAHKFGLRYVHLPTGRDGIAAARVADLTRVASHPAKFAGPPLRVWHCRC